MSCIYCTRVGCHRFVREAETPIQCQKCNDRLCEWCCDDREKEKIENVKRQNTRLVDFIITARVPKDITQPILAFELGEAVKALRSMDRVEPVETKIVERK